MTDSKEQAREKAVSKVLSVIDKAYVTIDEKKDKFVVKYNADSVKHDFPFTPPAPEFEKGTFGKFWDTDPDCPIYGYLTEITDQNYRYRRGAQGWKHFKPFYINDPIIERAFELACDLSSHCNNISNDEQKAHFLSQAKKELNQ